MEGVAEKRTIYTIGHSTHSIENFVTLLKRNRIDAIADVRSVPYSRWQPQFNREDLSDTLKTNGISYVFLGKELGARSNDPACYERGKVKYQILARTPLFISGIERVKDGSHRNVIALMCAEKDPLDCHRTILIARELVKAGADIAHVLENGQVESHNETLIRLCDQLGMREPDLFSTAEEVIEQAYDAQEQRVAYVDISRVREEQGVER